MKKFMVGIAALMVGVSAAQAAVDVNLSAAAAGFLTNATFVYNVTPDGTTFNSGNFGTGATASGGILGATGTVSVTWTATDVATPFVGTNWSYGANAQLYDYANGLGIASAGQTGGFLQFQAGEAFLLTFVTDLTPADGKIFVFSALPTDGDGLDVYQRTGESSGVLVAELPALTPAAYTPFAIVPAKGTNEFAIVPSSFGRLLQFRIDVMDDIAATAKPTGLTGIPIDSGALLSWNPDPTGFLDYYTVYRSTTPAAPLTYVAITNVPDAEFMDSGLVNDTTYYYAVTAVGTNGTPPESDFSDEIAITPVAVSTNTVLLMHYDASVASSVSLGTNSFVSTWTNQVTPGTYDATDSITGVIYPSDNLSNTGNAGLDFTTNSTRLLLMDSAQSDLLLDTTGGKSGFVVMLALRPEGIGTQQDMIGNGSTTSLGFGMRWTGTGFQSWLAGAETLATTAVNGDTVVVSFRYDVSKREFDVWESASLNSLTEARNPLDYSLAGDFTLGQTTSSGRNFNGNIFEVKIWGSTLDDATLAAEQSAMVTKWVGTTGYDTWAGLWTVDIGENTNDFDSDGLNNLYEYGLDGNPTNAAVKGTLPTFSRVGGGFEYIHPVRSDDETLAYTVQTTTNLVTGTWTATGYTVGGTNVTGGTLNLVTNTMDSVEDEKFIRLLINQN